MKNVTDALRDMCKGHTHSESNPCIIAQAVNEIECLNAEVSVLMDLLAKYNPAEWFVRKGGDPNEVYVIE